MVEVFIIYKTIPHVQQTAIMQFINIIYIYIYIKLINNDLVFYEYYENYAHKNVLSIIVSVLYLLTY